MNHLAPENVLVVLNPKAGRGPKGDFSQELCIELRQRGYAVRMLGSLEELRAATAPGGSAAVRTVLAIGGDGTVGAVANANRSGAPITVVPMGTENLLARHLGMQADVAMVCDAIDRNRFQQMDVGRVNGRRFLIMFSCGFDADVVHRLETARQGNISHSSYFKPILESLRNYEYPKLQITAEQAPLAGDTTVEVEGHWLFAFNLPRYAAGLALAPKADAHDGQLDVCVFRGSSTWKGFFHFATVLARCHGRWSDCLRRRFTRLRVESTGCVPYQVDGDFGGHLPVEIDMIPSGVSIMLPVDHPGTL